MRSGACRRAATTARHAGIVAAMRGRTDVSIGMPWSRAIDANARDWRSGVKPRSTYSSGDSASPTMRTRHSSASPYSQLRRRRNGSAL